MTDGQFNHAKFKKEQIESSENLKARLGKSILKLKMDEIDKNEILEIYSELDQVLNSLIEIRREEFKEI